LKSKSYLISSEIYLHARPAALLAQTTRKFKSIITIQSNVGYEINGKDPVAILSLCIKKNQKITIIIEGKDEEKAMEAIDRLMNTKINVGE